MFGPMIREARRQAYRFSVLVVLHVIAFTPLVTAQEGDQPGAPGGKAAEQKEAEAPTLAEDVAAQIDAMTSIRQLELELLPLRREELQAAAEEWIDRLQARTEVVAEADLAAAAAEGDARDATLQRATQLRKLKNAIAARAQIAVNALEAKGGDVEEYEQYITTVTPAKVDVTDTSALWITITDWIWDEQGGVLFATNIIFFALTLLAFWILSLILGRVVHHSLNRFKRASNLLRDFLAGLTRKTTILVGAVVALSMLGVNIGPLVAAIGAAGLVIGFALQGTLSNFASGIMILLYRPFDVGDVVDVAGRSGKVEAMTLVSTSIGTFDNQQLIVPNNSIWNNVITNVTGRPTRRVDLTFGISYADDIDKACAILCEVALAHELTLDDPPINIQVSGLGDSSVNLICRPWAKTEDYWTVYWDLMRQVKQRFDAEGITIPFPQRDVHLHQDATPEAEADG